MNTISNINLNGIISKLKDHAEQFRGTDLEKKVKDATSNANWGVTSQIKEEIAKSTFDYQSYNQVMNIIWKRMGESGKNWKMVFKSLDLLEYLLKHGSERVIAEAQGRQYQIRTLRDFHFSESDGRDKGGGIREKSRSICELLNDKMALDAERTKARSQVGKYMGISHYDSLGSSFNAHRTSAQYDPDYSFRDRENPETDRAGSSAVKKKKKKKKKKSPKPADDLSDDALSDSDDESRRTSIQQYNIPDPPASEKGNSKRKKKKDKRGISDADDSKSAEPSLIPDFFADSFAASQPPPGLPISSPLNNAFDISPSAFPAAPKNSAPSFDVFFSDTHSSTVQTVQKAPVIDPFQDLLQTPPPPNNNRNLSFQNQPSFTPAPLFTEPMTQQSLFSASAAPAQNSYAASPGFGNFSPVAHPTSAGESDDDWGFVGANNNQKPHAQIDFFGTPSLLADQQNENVWNNFSMLSISNPPQQQRQQQQQQQQQRQQNLVSPQADNVFAGFDFPASPQPANKPGDITSFF